jgi:AraC family transcriptional regulator, transcriptional activator of pobA
MIPVHKLQDRSSVGFQIVPFNGTDEKRSAELGAHRDDHYIFFLLTEGSGSAIVDFEEKTISANQMYYILPEQIHYRIKSYEAKGWFIAADPALINTDCRNIIESFQQSITLAPDEIKDYDSLLSILHHQTNKEGTQLSVLHSLLRSFFEMAASTIRLYAKIKTDSSRPAILSMQFKKLLHENIRSNKSPADYAAMLHISEPYLNEALKKVTGSTVSFWIKFTLLTEAKRLLYFTNLTVKEIANNLGFENHSYFSRFFYKETGMTALTFRKNNKSIT